MSIELYFNTDSAQFDVPREQFHKQAADTLRVLADRIDNGLFDEVLNKHRNIQDKNGNVIGKIIELKQRSK